MPERIQLHLEYTELLADYRKLAAVPFSDAAFAEMLKIASRMQEISAHIEPASPCTVTEQFSMLDAI